MSCDLNYKTAVRPLSTLEPVVYVNDCAPQQCKIQTPCLKKKVVMCETPAPICAPIACAPTQQCVPPTKYVVQSTYEQQYEPMCEPVCVDPCNPNPCGNKNWGWWSIILTFIIVFIIAWFLLYSLRPNAVLNVDANGNIIQPPTVNGGKVVIYSIVIALIVCLLLWAFRNSFRY